MIPSPKMVIHLKAEIELSEGSVLFGFEKVKLRVGYWKITSRLEDKVRMEEQLTGEVKLVSYALLGSMLATPTSAIVFVSEDDVPTIINL